MMDLLDDLPTILQHVGQVVFLWEPSENLTFWPSIKRLCDESPTVAPADYPWGDRGLERGSSWRGGGR